MLVTLAKALKIKNRQVAEVAHLQKKVSANNSYLIDSEPDFDSKVAYEDLQRAIEMLVDIKSKINEANLRYGGTEGTGYLPSGASTRSAERFWRGSFQRPFKTIRPPSMQTPPRPRSSGSRRRSMIFRINWMHTTPKSRLTWTSMNELLGELEQAGTQLKPSLPSVMS